MFPEGRAFEFLILAVVALVVVGPKDLPVLLRKVGQFMARVRSMAAEFRASFDEMARQSELDELRKEVEAMRRGQLPDMASHAPEVNQAFNEISQGLSDVGVSFDSPGAYPYVAAQTSDLEIPVETAPKPKRLASGKKPSPGKASAKAAAAKKPAAAKGAASKATAPKPAAKATPAAKKATSSKPVAPSKSAAPKAAAKPRARRATVS